MEEFLEAPDVPSTANPFNEVALVQRDLTVVLSAIPTRPLAHRLCITQNGFG